MAPPAPLVEELTPAPDAWDAARRLAHLPHLLFLDSADFHPHLGRYSYVTADPVDILIRPAPAEPGEDPFDDDRFECPRLPRPPIPELPPFIGGFAGLFGYGLGRAFEKVPPPRDDEFQVPDIAIGVYDWVISFDRLTGRAWLISTGVVPEDPDPSDMPARAAWRRDRVRDWLRLGIHAVRPPSSCRPVVPSSHHPLTGHPGVFSNFDRAGFEAAVRRAIDYIHAGDCFQVNLSQRLLAPQTEHAFDLYARLRERNPAPFAGYFDLGDFQIASASPERFLKVTGREVETRPIKGTRPRGATPAEDAALLANLAASPKDRAENVMIVDLLRNDLGRVCEYGSVRVESLCRPESYRTVHHLVSEVRGRLRVDRGPLDLLRAAFPGGSVTGAPKVRAMEIIAELEPTARGPYCGCLGYVGFDGSMDANILIRTFTCGRGWVQFPVGGGVVADSDPAREYEETLHKAAGLLRALK